MPHETQTRALLQSTRVAKGGRWGGGPRGRGHVYPWLIHVGAWQKTNQTAKQLCIN